MITGGDLKQAYVSGPPRSTGRRMRMAKPILLAALVGGVVLLATLVMVGGMREMYHKCGSVCLQGLQQVMRNRH